MLNTLSVNSSSGAKGHYLGHCFDYIELWRIPLGYINEQSIGALNKTYNDVLNRYNNQGGLLKVEYSIRHLLLITSPIYQS